MAKTIIALVGHIGSGKGAAASYLHARYGASVYRFSTILRELASQLYLPEEREVLSTMSRVLRDGFGQNLFADVMAKDIARDTHETIVLDGVRRKADIEELAKMPGFMLVHIDAPEEVRLGRLHTRKENSDDASKSLSEFRANRNLETEVSIDEVIPLATERIQNNGTYEELCRALDALMNRYASKD